MPRFAIILLVCVLLLFLCISNITEIVPYLLVRIKFALNLDTFHSEKDAIPF